MIVLTIGILTSCVTTPSNEKISIPEVTMALPERPVLQVIPTDLNSAIVVYSLNLVALKGYSERLEVYIDYLTKNRNDIIDILTE